MNFFFFLKEGLISLKRARVSAVISIVSICLSLTLIGIFGLLGQNLKDVFFKFYKEIEIEIFLEPDLTEEQIGTLKNEFEQFQQIEEIRFVTREEALTEFQNIFGEDINSILDENPLPASFRVTMKSAFSNPQVVEELVSEIRLFEGVQDVIYQREVIHFIHKYFKIAMIITIVLAVILIVVITILIFNTIRLTIYARRNIIQIMKLVGATNFFIKGPFILEGIIQGILGSALSLGLLWLFSSMLKNVFLKELHDPAFLYISLIGLGIFFGLVGSYLSVNKYLKYD